MTYGVRFEDSFNGATSTDLASHTPNTTGVSWTRVDSVAQGGHEIGLSDRVRAYTGAGSARPFAYTADAAGGSWHPNQEAEAIGVFEVTASEIRVGVRISADGSGLVNGYSAYYSTGNYRIARTLSGSDQVLNSTGYPDITGEEVVILRAEGSTLTLYVDGLQTVSASDTELSTGSVGLIGSTGTSVGFDYFIGRDVSASLPFRVYPSRAYRMKQGSRR